MTDLITPSNEVKVILNLSKMMFSEKAAKIGKNIMYIFDICTNITEVKKTGFFLDF